MGGIIATNMKIDKKNPMNSLASYETDDIEMDRATDTVEGRVEGIIDKDSPLMQSARTSAAQAQNRRGLVNSSMAIGAGQKAVIDTATPIAATDASNSIRVKEINKTAKDDSYKFGADAVNKGAMKLQDGIQALKEINARGSIDLGLQKMRGEQALDEIGLQGANQLNAITKQGEVNSALSTQNHDQDMILQNLRGDQAERLTQLETEANLLAQATSSTAIVSSSLMNAIGDILANDEIEPAQKQDLINKQMDAFEIEIGIIAKMNNIDVETLLDFSDIPQVDVSETGDSANEQENTSDDQISDDTGEGGLTERWAERN